jgi:hypothetical protein
MDDLVSIGLKFVGLIRHKMVMMMMMMMMMMMTTTTTIMTSMTVNLLMKSNIAPAKDCI